MNKTASKDTDTAPDETAVQNYENQNGHGTAIAKANSPKMVIGDLDTGDLPDLDKAPTAPLDFASEYWSPEAVGESRNMFFSHIENTMLEDKDSGEQKILPTAFFAYKKGTDLIMVRNASKRLLAALQNGGVQRGMGLEITYLGKKKNTTNQFMSDNWSVKPKLTKPIEIKE